MLSSGVRVVADVSDVFDVNGEQIELADDRLPSELSGDSTGVSLLCVRIRFRHDRSPYLDFGSRLGTCDDAVQQDSVIATQVMGLGRRRHHRQSDLAVHDQRFGSADASRAVLSRGADQKRPRLNQLFPDDRAESWLAVHHL
ncbi:hypothetical protein E0H73_45225 [Kribbella pittospori]|uniref:Uncharacterized protein n=1 Tax=Kribbella pittospori TaxID=722689 RepID=A0A4R0JRW9_9ACTN|nr:hypothetical protein [Kribbella pittospori]TCC44825.1 hypothetical protein E0H73_45225 [Kribbella pittospori]